MQDKDMDQLFRSKLDSYEVEPSARVWANISNELGAEKQRKSIVPMLRIAASVVVVVSAGVFFLIKKQNIVEPIKGGKNIAVLVKPANPVQVNNPTQPATKAQSSGTQPVNIAPHVKQAVHVNSGSQIAAVATKKVNAPVAKVDPIKVIHPAEVRNQINQPATALAVNDQTKTNNVADNPIKAGSTAAIPDVQIVDRTIPTVKPDIIASVQPDKSDNTGATKKRKATGLGGFLNKVIAAVDKRDDKIIEFTDTDEGDAITGINLGIIKVKKQK